MQSSRPNIDTNVIHRDLAGYYRAYGMLDSSTADGLFDRVVWRNVVRRGVCAPASASASAASASAAAEEGG